MDAMRQTGEWCGFRGSWEHLGTCVDLSYGPFARQANTPQEYTIYLLKTLCTSAWMHLACTGLRPSVAIFVGFKLYLSGKLGVLGPYKPLSLTLETLNPMNLEP